MATLLQAYPEARMTVTALKATATSEAAGEAFDKRVLQQPAPVAALTVVSNEYVHIQETYEMRNI